MIPHLETNLRPLALMTALIGGALSAFSCTAQEQPTPGHCANEQGDETCAQLGEGTPFCDGCGDAPKGCVAERPGDEGPRHKARDKIP